MENTLLDREYYAKEVYKNGFSLELLKSIKDRETIKVPASNPVLPFLPKQKEKKDSDYAYEAYGKALYFIDKREYKKALPYLEIAIKTDVSSLKALAYFDIGFCYDKLRPTPKQ